MEFARRAFLYIENSAIRFRTVFDDSYRETRSQINSILGAGHRIAAILPHRLEAREWHRLKLRLVQNTCVRFGNGLVRVRRCPMVCVFRRAEKRSLGASIRIERGERSIHYNKSNSAQGHGKLDQHLFGHLKFGDPEGTTAGS